MVLTFLEDTAEGRRVYQEAFLNRFNRRRSQLAQLESQPELPNHLRGSRSIKAAAALIEAQVGKLHMQLIAKAACVRPDLRESPCVIAVIHWATLLRGWTTHTAMCKLSPVEQASLHKIVDKLSAVANFQTWDEPSVIAVSSLCALVPNTLR